MRKPFYLLAAFALLGAAACSGSVTGPAGRTTSAPTHDGSTPPTSTPPDTTGRGGGTLGSGG